MAAASSSPQAPPGGFGPLHQCTWAPSPEAQACPDAPTCLCVRGPGWSPNEPTEGDSEGGRGQWFGSPQTPPEQTGQEKEVSGDERGNRQSAHQETPQPPPPALPTCLLMSALHPEAGELERLGPSAGHRGPRPQVQKESPFLCRQEARPVHHIPVCSCPWKPSPHRQALPAACCLHPQPSSPTVLAICNAFFGGNVYSVSLPNFWLSCLFTC